MEKEITDADRIRALRNLLGSCSNGEGQTVIICEDDATRDFVISAGGRHYWGETLRLAFDNLINKSKEEAE